MNQQIGRLKSKLEQYEQLQHRMQEQRELYAKNMHLMQQQLDKNKAIVSNLLRKAKHKRTCSEQQTFIFNQTNISSYYPVLMPKTRNWAPSSSLRSHLDSVRAVCWQNQFLLSGGDDCLLKIWERDRLKLTIREHLAPIYTICGDSQAVFTGGPEGVVRQWCEHNFLNGEHPQAEVQSHQDSIWQMIWNPASRVLTTSSADGSLKIIKSAQSHLNELGKISTLPFTPTSIHELPGHKLVSGLAEAAKLSEFDQETGKKLCDLPYQSKQECSQANKLIYSTQLNVLISGHEDRTLRFSSPNESAKFIKTLMAHSESVSSVSLQPNHAYELISCGHDGRIRIWDIRKYRCVGDIAVHMSKYDESVICIAHSQNEPVAAVGGADGQIKLICPYS